LRIVSVQLRPLSELVNPQTSISSTPSKRLVLIAALLLSLILVVVVIVVSVSEEMDENLFRIDTNAINNFIKIRNEQETTTKNKIEKNATINQYQTVRIWHLYD
jgi:hypothetical protein